METEQKIIKKHENPSDKLELLSLTDEGGVFPDSYKKLYYGFGFGAKVEVILSDHPLRVIRKGLE